MMEDFFFAAPNTTPTYPPYNIEQLGDDEFQVTIAVAGFTREEVTVNVDNRALVVEGKKSDPEVDRNFVYRGIANRDFRREFKLMEYVVVKGARMENGLLVVDLKRELPEGLKPRVIDIA
jgi:molecular chaperone IbpA